MKEIVNTVLAVKILIGSLLLLLLLPQKSTAQTKEKLEKEFKKIIKLEPSIRMDEIPGYVIGIIKQDSTYLYGYGNVSATANQTPDASTIFEVGGLSKVFTASLVEILVAEGQLHLDSSLNAYLPPSFRNAKLAHVQLIDLLTHASGLPKMPNEFGAHEKEPNNPYAHYSKKDLLNFYKDFSPLNTEGVYQYSHVNFALLEIVIEQKFRRNFEDLLQEKLLDPLGLKETFITNTDSLPIAQGYSIGGQKSELWTFQSFAASEGIKTSTGDLLKLARYNLKSDAHLLSPLLIQTHQKRTVTDYSKKAFSARGWHVLEKKRFYDTIIHTGNTSGFRSFFAFVPESQTAVIILSNSETATGGLGYLIMRMINSNFKKRKVKRKN